MSGPRRAQALTCPACKAEVSPEDVSEAALVARCRACNKVFDLTARLRQAVALRLQEGGRLAPVPAEAIIKPRRDQPFEAQVVEQPGRLTVTLPTYRRRSTSRLLMRVVSLVVVTTSTTVAVIDGRGRESLAYLGFPLLAGLLYSTIAALLNRLRIVVERESVTLSRTPIPMPGSRRFARSELKQLFVEERPALDIYGQHTGSIFALSALVGFERRREVLAENLTDAGSAVWLEQTLERALNIKDEPVGGEFQG